MSGLKFVPEAVQTAMADIGNIGATIRDANLAAVRPTTAMLPPGADEVSEATTALFNRYAQQYQQLAQTAANFHHRLTQNLAAAGDAYQQTEQAALQALRDQITQLETPLIPYFEQGFGSPPTTITPITVPTNSLVGLVVGGTNNPFSTWLLQPVISTYSLPSISSLVFTPEQFWPLTPQFGGLTLGQSVSQGVALVNQAINTELAAGNHVIVWGTSQSAVILTDEIRNLMAAGSPNAGQLSFILTGDPNNPDGGILERLTGGYIPVIDLLANSATPPNSPYQVTIYTNQYDAIGDFPRYPLNVVSDTNAVMGAFLGQHAYAAPRTYYQLPTSPDYTGNTTYYMSLDPTLPLLTPLRELGASGNAIADLLQPDLRVIVDMGYGSGDYANIPTPASLLEIPNLARLTPDLATGAVQGAQAFGVDVGWLPSSDFPTTYPYTPVLDPGLSLNLGQSSVTGLSVLTGAEGQLMADFGQIPSWDD